METKDDKKPKSEVKEEVKKEEEKINTRELKVKDLRKLLKGQDDEKHVIILSSTGMEWRLNEEVMENPKVTATCGKAFYLKIVGEGGKFPRCPDDGGLVRRFVLWSLEHEISSIRGIVFGGGMYEAVYHCDDQDIIEQWLRENGVEMNR